MSVCFGCVSREGGRVVDFLRYEGVRSLRDEAGLAGVGMVDLTGLAIDLVVAALGSVVFAGLALPRAVPSLETDFDSASLSSSGTAAKDVLGPGVGNFENRGMPVALVGLTIGGCSMVLLPCAYAHDMTYMSSPWCLDLSFKRPARLKRVRHESCGDPCSPILVSLSVS